MADSFKFSKESLELAGKIISRYPEGRQKSALIPLLHIAQAENDGWLSVPVMDYIAGILQIQTIEVYEVASFYTMFNLEPVGNFIIEVCQTGPCWLNGAEDIITFFENRLEIKAGQTTADGKFTLKRVECLAACGNSPVIRLGNTYLENVTAESAEKIISEFSSSKQSLHKNPYSG